MIDSLEKQETFLYAFPWTRGSDLRSLYFEIEGGSLLFKIHEIPEASGVASTTTRRVSLLVSLLKISISQRHDSDVTCNKSENSRFLSKMLLLLSLTLVSLYHSWQIEGLHLLREDFDSDVSGETKEGSDGEREVKRFLDVKVNPTFILFSLVFPKRNITCFERERHFSEQSWKDRVMGRESERMSHWLHPLSIPFKTVPSSGGRDNH